MTDILFLYYFYKKDYRVPFNYYRVPFKDYRVPFKDYRVPFYIFFIFYILQLINAL
jgi:hypothetical protein